MSPSFPKKALSEENLQVRAATHKTCKSGAGSGALPGGSGGYLVDDGFEFFRVKKHASLLGYLKMTEGFENEQAFFIFLMCTREKYSKTL